MRRRIHWNVLITSALIVLTGVLACRDGARAVRPLVTILAPVEGSTVAVNAPVIVEINADDPAGAGVAWVDVLANGAAILSIEPSSGPQSPFNLSQIWTPPVEGEVTLSVIAYREDGTASLPATVSLLVVGMTLAPSPGSSIGTPSIGSTTTPSPLEPAPPREGVGRGRVTMLSNVRSGPGPWCQVVGGIDEGVVINLLEFSADGAWYLTDYVGGVGWVFSEQVALLSGADDILPGDAVGCMGCGDGICNLDETCDSCVPDCGECCGNGLCEPEYGEDCGMCEADCGPCCGDGICEPERGEDCGTCETDCGPCCGDGVCEPGRGEDCGTCDEDCGPCCGDGICEPARGEDCTTCLDDCGPCPICGDGAVDPGEECDGDDGLCGDGICLPDCTCGAVPICGDGVIDPAEECDGDDGLCGDGICLPDCTCGPAPICGDGVVDPGEECDGDDSSCGGGACLSDCTCGPPP